MKQWTRSEFRAFVKQHTRSQHRLLWGIAEWAPFGGTVVIPNGDPYLLRVYLTPSLRKWGLPRPFLHFFFRGDADKELHNHPWLNSVSLLLTGGYTEWRWDSWHREVTKRILFPGDLNIIRRNDYHRVELSHPEEGCWTLFITGDRAQESDGYDWEFLDTETGERTPWGAFVSQRAERVDHAAVRT